MKDSIDQHRVAEEPWYRPVADEVNLFTTAWD
ncbi:MAG: AAA family ATPase, partial [Rhodobacter sp.]|nr:AAA family ATPase [Rhodobacter sp.]